MSLQGTLTTLGITEVLEFLAQRAVSGKLDVSTEMGTATFMFSEGNVTQCDYSFIRESGDDSAEATYYVVSELDGTFFFDEDHAPVDVGELEDVASVLARTAEIAEQWSEVETMIPTPNHLLVRNTELDGSVTIQPEWWKTLEVIGTGKSSLEIAATTSQGLLASSRLVLDMTKAGLLNVEEVDPMSVDVLLDPDAAEPDLAEVEVSELAVDEMSHEAAPVQLEVEPLIAPSVPTPVASSEPAPASSALEAVSDHSIPDQSIPTDFSEPVPATQVAVPTPEDAFAPAFEAPQEAPAVVEPIAAPVPEPVAVNPAPAPEPVAVNPAPAPEPVAVNPAPAPVPEPVAVDPNDGWASNHSLSYDEAQSEAPVAPAVNSMEQPVAAPIEQAAPVPTEQPAVEQYLAPPVPETDSTAVAGEVLSDLATLDQLGEEPDESNWQLDDTFATEEQAPPPAADDDPFGELGSLLDESEDEDRGSVLKFLRRD